MKQFALVVFLACVAATLAAPRLEADPAKAKASQEKLKEAHQKCQSNPATSVDQQALKALRDGGEKPANYGAHALCISQVRSRRFNREEIEQTCFKMSARYNNKRQIIVFTSFYLIS